VKLLLDTHLVLWASGRPDRLPAGAPDILNDPSNILVFSVASIWEAAIKHALRRDDFDNEPVQLRDGLLDNGYVELPITGLHAAAVAHLPRIHRDPFDRLLVAQAMVEGITLLTADPVLARYPAPVRLV
jgi:PIN domain nuclease of toxin-antitoxin system